MSISVQELAFGAHERGERLVVPLMGFPGVGMANTSIKVAQQNYCTHVKVVKGLAERFKPDLIFPLMDLAVEANALGRYTVFPRHDSATVPKQTFHHSELDALRDINIACDCRVQSYVETIRHLRAELPAETLVGAYVAGPYSLAGLIMGAEEAAMATVADTEALAALCDFTAETIRTYAGLLMDAGAQVVCMLEPSAVMIGPDQFREFSTRYVSTIAEECRVRGVGSVYHTCGNTIHVFEIMAHAGVDGLSLDAPCTGVDLKAVVERVPEDVLVIGNICPATTMLSGSTEEVRGEVEALLKRMAPHPNFVLGTGCDLPPETPLENIEAFMRAGRG
ncbi:MAG: uroporphyrinogen decarboxylase family protein [FCB group bacterium]|jgi:uroporphyrinogen decarboxylase|nr:uroporphyrinogen decarboxylase family protein [FCB group bacterium]